MTCKRVVTFDVVGVPQTKGSTRLVRPRGRRRLVVTNDNPKCKAWERSIAVTARQREAFAAGDAIAGAVILSVSFVLPRPHRLTKRIRLAGNGHHVGRPDLDKLVRAVNDALRGTAYLDDAQIVEVHAYKQYGDAGAVPFARITIAEAAPPAISALIPNVVARVGAR